jgi:hypothetical protein
LNVPVASDTVLTLQASDPGIQVPGTVTVPAGSVSQQFTYTVTDQANVHRVFKISALLGSEQESAYNFVLTDRRVQTGFGFLLQWPSQQVYPGLTSTDFQPYYTTQPNYETTLDVSCSGLPTGLSCAFNPASPTLIPNSYLTGSMVVNAENGVAPGTYNFEATASDTDSSITVPASITVLPPTPILNVSSSFRLYGIVGASVPAIFTVKNVGDEPAHNVLATLLNDPTQLRASALTSSSGNCSLTSKSCSLGTLNPGDIVTVTVTQTLLSSGALEFALRVTDAENSQPAVAGVEILASDYSLSLSTTILTVNPGSQGNVTVNLEPLGGEGFDDSISLSCTGLPAGATCSFSPTSVTLGFNPGTAVLTITIPQASAKVPDLQPTHPRRALFALFVAPFGVVVFATPRKRLANGILLGVLFGAILLLQSCGGGGGSSSGTTGGGSGGSGGGSTPPPPPSYSVKVIAAGAGDQHSVTLTLTVP